MSDFKEYTITITARVAAFKSTDIKLPELRQEAFKMLDRSLDRCIISDDLQVSMEHKHD